MRDSVIIEEVEHPETGVLHQVIAETRTQLDREIADILVDVADLTPRGLCA